MIITSTSSKLSVADISTKTTGSVKASHILPDGQEGVLMQDPITGEIGYIRKGTVAATMANINNLNRLLLLERTNTAEEKEKIEELCTEIKEILPSLRVIGIFRFFSPLEWLGDQQQPGRSLVAIFLLQEHPELLNYEILKRLEFLKQDAPKFLHGEMGKITP